MSHIPGPAVQPDRAMQGAVLRVLSKYPDPFANGQRLGVTHKVPVPTTYGSLSSSGAAPESGALSYTAMAYSLHRVVATFSTPAAPMEEGGYIVPGGRNSFVEVGISLIMFHDAPMTAGEFCYHMPSRQFFTQSKLCSPLPDQEACMFNAMVAELGSLPN